MFSFNGYYVLLATKNASSHLNRFPVTISMITL